MARSAYSRFRDNMGRAVRRLNEAIRNEDNQLKKQAYENQKKRIENFRDKVAKHHKQKNFDLNEAMEKWKSRKDLSGGKKTAEEIEKDRLQSQLSGDMTKKDINDIFENFPNMSKSQQDFYEALLQYDSLEGTYIGQYGKEDIIIEASNLKDKMQAIRKQDLDDHSRELLLEKMNEIDMAMSAQGNRKENFYSGVLGAKINKTLFQGLESKQYDFSEIDEY